MTTGMQETMQGTMKGTNKIKIGCEVNGMLVPACCASFVLLLLPVAVGTISSNA